MGVVYRAYHPELERVGAVKVLQAISPDADTVARFRHEAQAIAQMRHPNIVNVYDFGEFQGTPYMIVEFVPGGSLASRMSHGSLDHATALKYLRGIAAGLDHAHGHGIVHRDVKPANVLLTAEDAPVLVDFGLAKLLRGSSLKSMTGVTTGTPAYMAPEQVAGNHVGPAADRYALASIAYEMLTGVIPFDGEGLMELLYAQVHREPLPPSSRYPLLSTQVDAVIMRGLAKDPAARWDSCSAFVESLAAALSSVPSPAPVIAKTMVIGPPTASTVPLAGVAVAERHVAPPQAATVAVAYPSPNGTGAASPAKRLKRLNRRLVLGIAATVLLLLLLGICQVALAATTIAVSPNRAARGDTVNVSATHVPANQVGEIQLWSVVHTYPFHADAQGNVSLDMTVPRDVALGDHVVKICWKNSCYAQAPLRVFAEVAQASPTPVANTSPGATPAAGSPPPTATPRATPTSVSSTPRPTSAPGSTPTPTSKPTPPPSPNPTPPSATLVSVTASTVVAGIVVTQGVTKVTFHNFNGGTAVVGVCQKSTCHSVGSIPVGAGPNVTVSFNTPSAIVPSAIGGQAYVVTSCCGSTNLVSVI